MYKRAQKLNAEKKVEDGLLEKIANDLIIRYAAELSVTNLKSDKAKRLQGAIMVARDTIEQIKKVAHGIGVEAEDIKNLKKGKK